MASLVTNKGAYDALSSWWSSNTWKAMLCGTGLTPAKTHNFVSDIVAQEIAPTGYARQTLASKTVTEDDTNHRVILSCGNIAFGALAAGATIAVVVFFRFVTADADSPVFVEDDVTDTPTNGSTITYVPHANGIAYTQE